MKPVIGIVLCAVCLYSAVTWAAPAYGPHMAAPGEFITGFRYNNVLERTLESPYGEMSSEQFFQLFSFGLTERITLDLKFGLGSIERDPDAGETVAHDPVWGGGYGFRVLLLDDDVYRVVTGFQHISIHPTAAEADGVKYKSILDDWQVSLLVARQFKDFSPYVGGQYSRMDHITWVNEERNRMKSDTDKGLGLFTGFDYNFSETIWLNVEAHTLDETAFSVSVHWKL